MLMLKDPVIEGLFGLGSGVISGIASLFGADAQSKNVRATNEMNYRIAQETNANQMQMARENNQMQLDAMRENNAFNKQSAIDMFNLEAAYNDPSAQKERLLAAGFNPATLYGQGGSVGGSVNASTPSASSSGISPSMPNFVTPTMQTPPSVLNGMFGNIESLTRSIGNVAKSGLDLMTKRSLSAKLGPEIDKMINEIEESKIRQASEQFKFNLDTINLPKRQEKELAELASKIFKNYAEGGASHALIAVHEAESIVKSWEGKSIEQQLPILIDNLKKLGIVYEEQAETERSKQNLNNANAGESRSRTKLNEQEYKFLESVNSLRAKIVENEEYMSWAEKYKTQKTIQQQVEYILNKTWISDEEKSLLREQLRNAQKTNDWQEWKNTIDMMESLSRSFSNVTSGVPLPNERTVVRGFR